MNPNGPTLVAAVLVCHALQAAPVITDKICGGLEENRHVRARSETVSGARKRDGQLSSGLRDCIHSDIKAVVASVL
jgi:hypothetical protein